MFGRCSGSAAAGSMSPSRTIMMVDSLEMTDADRETILANCRQAHEKRIVITHGTDTMVETARVLAEGAPTRRSS